MHLKLKWFFAVLPLCLLIAGCLGSSGQTPCKLRSIYQIQNSRNDTVFVNTVDSSIAWTGIEVAISIRHDSLSIFPNSTAVDTIDFHWTGVHGCYITGGSDGSRNAFRTCAKIFSKGTIIASQFLWPIDTAQLVYNVCTDCTQELYDTIAIR